MTRRETWRRSAISAIGMMRRADCVLEQFEKAFSSLSEYPECGNYPTELLDIGIREYREIFSKPTASSIG